VDLSDGRRLEVEVAGPADGVPFVLQYGTPSSPVLYQPLVATATRLGLRTIIYARPGYGASTPRPGRSVADAAADVAAVLDAMGGGRFVTLGWSGGGPHALACAALLSQRCLAAASVAGVAPYDAAGLDWSAGMGAENIEEFQAAARGEAALTGFLDGQASALATVTGGEIAAALGDLISEVDRRALSGDFAEHLAASMRGAVASGVAGWLDDDLAFVRDWGFAPGQGSWAPVAIWQGAQDRMVPYAHGGWLADWVPDAHAHLLPGDGHLSLLAGGAEEILTDLVALAGLSG
jgi:pimeloyl-ACP methyl ester carboxylesterase